MTYAWLTTAPNPRVRATGFDQGQRGWKLHAVEGVDSATKFSELRESRAMCGILPRHGWDLDMFIEDKCERCASKLALLTAAQRPQGKHR